MTTGVQGPFQKILGKTVVAKTDFLSLPLAANIKKLEAACESIRRPFVSTIYKQKNGFLATTVLRSQSKIKLGLKKD